jgi:hypothetical protein
MKNSSSSGLQVSAIQLFCAVTFLLPFTLVLGVAWLCQVYHHRNGKRLTTADELGANGGRETRGVVVVNDNQSLLLPVCLSA